MRHVVNLRVEVDTKTAIEAARLCADALGAVKQVEEVRLMKPSANARPTTSSGPSPSAAERTDG